jgi:hypothetical protein
MAPNEKDTPEMVQEFRASVDVDHGSTLTLTDQNIDSMKTKLQNFFGGPGAVRFAPTGTDGNIIIYHKKWMNGDQPAGEINRLYKTAQRGIGQRLQYREQQAA